MDQLRLPGADATPAGDVLWTVDDLAAFLRLPKGTLYQWRYRGYGPSPSHCGRALRYDPAVVRAWVAEQRVAS